MSENKFNIEDLRVSIEKFTNSKLVNPTYMLHPILFDNYEKQLKSEGKEVPKNVIRDNHISLNKNPFGFKYTGE